MCTVWWFLKPSLTISSTRIHLFLKLSSTGQGFLCLLLASLAQFHPQGIISFSSMARIMLGKAGLPLINPSTRKHIFLVYGSKIMLVIACLSLTTPFIWNLLFLPQRGLQFLKDSVGCCRPPSDFSIQQE